MERERIILFPGKQTGSCYEWFILLKPVIVAVKTDYILPTSFFE